MPYAGDKQDLCGPPADGADDSPNPINNAIDHWRCPFVQARQCVELSVFLNKDDALLQPRRRINIYPSR